MAAGSFSFPMRITLEGRVDPIEVTAGPPDIIRFERKYNVAAGALGKADEMRFEWLAFLAWSVARRRHPGEFGELDQFIDQLENLEMLVDDDAEAGDATGEASPVSSPT